MQSLTNYYREIFINSGTCATIRNNIHFLFNLLNWQEPCTHRLRVRLSGDGKTYILSKNFNTICANLEPRSIALHHNLKPLPCSQRIHTYFQIYTWAILNTIAIELKSRIKARARENMLHLCTYSIYVQQSARNNGTINRSRTLPTITYSFHDRISSCYIAVYLRLILWWWRTLLLIYVSSAFDLEAGL